MITKRYLGDGVYADYDFASDQFILTTEDGERETNRIFLDGALITAWREYVSELRTILKNAHSDEGVRDGHQRG